MTVTLHILKSEIESDFLQIRRLKLIEITSLEQIQQYTCNTHDWNLDHAIPKPVSSHPTGQLSLQ
jgi:hypothetical protein